MDHCLSNTHTPGSSTPLWSTYIKPIIIHHLPPTHTLLPSALASTHRCIQAEAIRDHTQQEHCTIYGHRTIHVTHCVLAQHGGKHMLVSAARLLYSFGM